MNFDILERAGLTQQEFADLTQFSRPSVNLWINERKPPGARARRALDAALAILAKTVEEGHLPTTNTRNKEKLLAHLRGWVASTAANQ